MNLNPQNNKTNALFEHFMKQTEVVTGQNNRSDYDKRIEMYREMEKRQAELDALKAVKFG